MKKCRRRIRPAQIIVPSAAALALLGGCKGTDSSSDTKDTTIDNPSFTTPVALAGLPGATTGFDSYTVFQPALADVDGDGDLDLFAGSFIDPAAAADRHRVSFFINGGSKISPSFSLSNGSFTNLPEITEGGPTDLTLPMFTGTGDIDKDGDPDLLTTSSSFLSIAPQYELVKHVNNSGTLSSTQINSPSNQYAAVTLADLDGDGDPDAVIGRSKDQVSDKYDIIMEKNNGSGTFNDGTVTLVPETDITAMTEIPVPSFADLDNDGDQDMFVIMYNDGTVSYYENTGSKTSPTFTKRTATYGLSPTGGEKWFPAFGDLDGDGDLDAMIGTSTGKILYSENRDIE